MPGTLSKILLLCEGWEGTYAIDAQGALVCVEEGSTQDEPSVFYPSSAYVEQGDKLCVLAGELDESVSTEGKTLVSSLDEMDLEEKSLPDGATAKLPKGGRWIVEGPAQRSDVKNANKRVYPRSIWEKLIGDSNSYVQKMIQERGMVGHLEHPKDGRTDGAQGAILTTKSELREDGVVWNQFEVLDTPHGRILQEYIRKGVRWGVSSRGNGSVNDAGIVEEATYLLKTWDAVMAPSTPGAFPGVKETPESEETSTESLEEGKGSVQAKHAKMMKGEVVVATPDELEALEGMVWSDYLASKRNPNRVGTKDAWIVWFKNKSKGPDEAATDEGVSDTQKAVAGRLKKFFAGKKIPVSIRSSSRKSEFVTVGSKGDAEFPSEMRAAVLRAIYGKDMGDSAGNVMKGQMTAQAGQWSKFLGECEETDNLSVSGEIEDSEFIDSVIDSALEEQESSDPLDGATEIIETLQEQISDSVTENTELRRKLEAAESTIEALTGQRDEAVEQLSEVRGDLARTSRERDLAYELLSEAPARSENRAVSEAVDSEIGKAPKLEKFRSLLEAAETVEQVHSLVEDLNPTVPPAESPDPPVVSKRPVVPRISVPVGAMLESTETVPPSRQRARAHTSSGAQLAAKAIAATKQKQ